VGKIACYVREWWAVSGRSRPSSRAIGVRDPRSEPGTGFAHADRARARLSPPLSRFNVIGIGYSPKYTGNQAASSIFAETMRSGLATGSPRLILSMFSIPSVTRPQTVY
jgi:hypothetical protein